MSILLALHIAAITTAHLAASPSSEVEQSAAYVFKRYFDLINQGYGYRYYARLDTSVSPEHRHPWGTPIVSLEMEFDGPGGEIRKESLRLPELPESSFMATTAASAPARPGVSSQFRHAVGRIVCAICARLADATE